MVETTARSVLVLSVLMVLHLFAPPVYATILVQSTFTTDREGFTATWPADVGTAAIWRSAEGNPPGCLGAADRAGATNSTWFYFQEEDSSTTADKFMGNHANAYGGTLAYDVLLYNPSGTYYSDYDVVLYGGEPGSLLTLTYRGGFQPVTTQWSTFVVPLIASAGWKKEVGGAPATEANLLGVLSHIRQLEIRGSYLDGPLDGSRLDNLTLSSPDVIPEPCAFAVWSLLAGSSIALGWRRRNRAA